MKKLIKLYNKYLNEINAVLFVTSYTWLVYAMYILIWTY